MNKVNKSLSFQELLNYCSDQTSPLWEAAWLEFIKRYKKFIYSKVKNSCVAWNIPRLQRQISDAVADVVNEIFHQLIKNNCQALNDFRARDNERMFLAWLATICSRITSRHIKDYFSTTIIKGALEENKEYITNLDLYRRWELYEFLIERLREFGINKKRYLERDINIFQMYTWADFSAPMISIHPCLKHIGHRVVDNVVNRMRNFLRNGETFLK